MNDPLPPSGFAEDILPGLPRVDRGDPNQIADFVEQVAPPAWEAPVQPDPTAQLLLFLLDEELFAVPVDRVREVIRVHSITRIPQAPPHVRGVHGLRGAIIPVVEARIRMGKAPSTLGPDSRIVVVESGSRRIGLLVDSVFQVCTLPRSRIGPPPRGAGEAIVGTASAGERLALLLDLDELISLEDR